MDLQVRPRKHRNLLLNTHQHDLKNIYISTEHSWSRKAVKKKLHWIWQNLNGDALFAFTSHGMTIKRKRYPAVKAITREETIVRGGKTQL